MSRSAAFNEITKTLIRTPIMEKLIQEGTEEQMLWAHVVDVQRDKMEYAKKCAQEIVTMLNRKAEANFEGYFEALELASETDMLRGTFAAAFRVAPEYVEFSVKLVQGYVGLRYGKVLKEKGLL